MHVDLTITVGGIVLFLTVLGGVVRIERTLIRIDRLVSKFNIEHEMLISDFCDRKNIEPASLPTRMPGIKL